MPVGDRRRVMWILVLLTLAVNSGAVHSNIETIRFLDQQTCEKAASALEQVSVSAPSGGQLVASAKCIRGTQ
jgi:hypothetical protein